MSQRQMPVPLPAEEDPVVHAYLSALATVPPSAGFEARVLSHVWRTPPRWVHQARERWVELVETGRIWFLVGAFAAGSLIPLGVATGLVVAFAGQINTIGGWMVATFGPGVLGGLAAYWAAATQSMASWWAVAPSNIGMWAGAAGAVVTVSAAGLLWTLRRGS